MLGKLKAGQRGSLMESKTGKRILAENILICMIGALAVMMIITSFLYRAKFSDELLEILEVKRMSARLLGVVLLILLYHLYRRKKIAWYFTSALLIFNIVRHMLPPLRIRLWGIVLLEVICLLMLFYFRTDFCCPSSRSTLRKSLLMLCLAAVTIVLNAGISYHLIKINTPGIPHKTALWDSLLYVGGIILGTNPGMPAGTRLGRVETVLFWFSWICMLIALLFALRPWIARFLWTEDKMQRARKLVLKYGQNPASYLTLESDKLLYFSKNVEGVLPYGIVGNTVIVNGDPVCAPEDFPAFLAEFRDFCVKSDHKLFFLSITERFLDEYKKQGFGTAKCGEEARFDMAAYEITGKKGAKMRMNINHAVKAGITVKEYCPLKQRDLATEAELNHITDEWLKDKKSGLLSFTMGTVGLENPMDRRYFYAIDSTGKICGLNVYCPYDDDGKGYMADITRRTHDAPGGVTEKIMYDAFGVFKQEGVKSVSMGIAPLANLVEPDENPNTIEKLLNFIYEHLNSCYGFKNLYRAKENYSPTKWLPGYYAWLPKIPDPSMFYAVARIQNPKGLWDYIRAFIPERRSKPDKNRQSEDSKSELPQSPKPAESAAEVRNPEDAQPPSSDK